MNGVLGTSDWQQSPQEVSKSWSGWGAGKPKGLNRISKKRLRSPMPEGGEP
jgi:hypothetical protein